MSDVVVDTTELLADWIEVCVLISDSGHLSCDTINDLAKEELGKNEASVSIALHALRRRAASMGEAYPLRVYEFAVLRRECPWAEAYSRLLHLTPGSVARQTTRQSDVAFMGETLEELAESALTNFWGAGGEALAFGYPSRHGRPQEFHLAVPWLASRIGVKPGRGYRPPRRKDGGVDVVAWRQFRDGRPGFPIALAQCTVQAEAFTKTTDIDLRLWSSWLACDTDPLSLLVIPGTIRAAGPEWDQLTTVVTVIDRVRLMELISRGDQVPTPEPWTDETWRSLKLVMKASER